MSIKSAVLVFLMLRFEHTTYAHTLEDSERLLSNLTTGYNKHVRPGQNQSEAVQVNVSFAIGGIKEFDGVKGELIITGGLELAWVDTRLSWDFTAYNNCYYTQLPIDWVWKPGFHLENAVESIKSIEADWMPVLYIFNGKAIWNPRDLFELSCGFNIKYYPFDTQFCSALFAPNLYASTELKFHATKKKASRSYYYENGEWELVDTDTSVIDVGISIFQVTLILKRRPVFVLVNVVLPMVIMGILNIFVFVLPADSGERMSYAVTILLAIAVFLTIVSDNIPRTSSPMSILCYFIGAQIIQSSAICLATILNLRLFHKDDEVPVPTWVMFCCGKCKNKKRVTRKTKRKTENVYAVEEGNRPGDYKNLYSVSNGRPRAERRSRSIEPTEDGRISGNYKDIYSVSNGRPRVERLSRSDESTEESKITWKEISFAVDKIMFVISLIFLLAGCLCFAILIAFPDEPENTDWLVSST